MYRRLELDEALFLRSSAVIEKALQGGLQLTRSELAAALAQAGIIAQGLRLGYIVHHAELEGLICSGARRGKQFTYALLHERAPQARTLPRDEALAALVRRFFTSHGPATQKDFAWWSGLTLADARAGLEMAGPDLVEEEFHGRACWRAASGEPVRDPSPTAYLLPPYDEFTIAYKDTLGVLDPQHLDQAKNALYGGAMVIDGQMVGYWRRKLGRQAVAVEFAPFRPLAPVEHEAFSATARRYGEFLGLPVALE
jgi:hypothetical protein